jgi:PEP-CTERM motif
LLFVFAWGAASAALAGRGTQINDEVTGSRAACTVGSSSNCTAVNISASGVFDSAYIYEEGIVSIDALLPDTFNIADPSTYGGVIFFTPGYDATGGTTYFVSAYFASSAGSGEPPFWGFNFFTSEADRDATLFPDMQVQLGTSDPNQDPNAPWVGVMAALGYNPGFEPPADSWIGFSWGSEGLTQLVQNNNGLLVGSEPAPADTDFISTATVVEGTVTAASRFTPLYATTPGDVPEPATWAMMLTGFGLIGLALRRRSVKIALA